MGTKKPKITSISRDGYKFIVKWKHGQKGYTAQDVDFYVYLRSEATFNKATKLSKKDKALKKWDKKSKSKGNIKFIEKIKVKKNSTSASYTLNSNSYYPTNGKPKVVGVEFRVRGKKGKSWSGYDYKTFDIDKPKKKPSISKTLGENAIAYTVNKPDGASHNPVKDVFWKKVILPKCSDYTTSSVFKKSSAYDKDDGSFAGSSHNVTATAKNYLVEPQTSIIWAQARNMSGAGPWKKDYHTFSNPRRPKNVKVLKTEVKSNNTIEVTLSWSASADKVKQPTDSIYPQYLITVPVITINYVETEDTKIDSKKDYYIFNDETDEYEYVETPDAEDLDSYYELKHVFEPSQSAQSQWTDAYQIKRSKTNDSAVITIPNTLPVDNCLFIRVRAVHDGNSIPSDYVLALKGVLSAPTVTNIVLDDSDPCTYKATVTAKNNSSVTDSFVAIVYNDSNKDSIYNGKVLGIIESGESVSFQCPKWDNLLPLSFGAYAIYGEINYKDTVTETVQGLDDPIIQYAFYEDQGMKSDVSYKAGDTPSPVPASSVNLSTTDISGTVQVSWNNPWTEATGVEVSWADHEDAWYSTNGPSTYTVTTIQKSILNISGLEEGKKWYVRVRFFKTISESNTIYGPYSKIYDIDLTQKPAVPILNISPSDVVNIDTEITASWVYVTNDGTEQDKAELVIVETLYSLTTDVTIDSTKQYYILEDDKYVLVENPVVEDIGTYYEITGYNYDNPFLSAETQRHITFKPSDEGVDWSTGATYDLALRVHSESGNYSDYSNIETIRIAEPPVCTINSTNLTPRTEAINTYEKALEFDPNETYYIFNEDDPSANNDGYVEVSIPVEIDLDNYYLKTVSNVTTLYLTSLPLEVEVVGSGENGTTMLAIERFDSINVDRPDENSYDTYPGETIYQSSPQTGEAPISISLDDLNTSNAQFDDGGVYTIVATIQDESGQIATVDTFEYDGQTIENFTVSWDHQAIVPEGEVTITEEGIAEIKAKLPETLPSGWSLADGDSIDIYRLSAGKPELLKRGAKIYDPNNPDETTYIDPFPTIGKRGGYRIVFITENGDYYAPVQEDGRTFEVPAWIDINAGLKTRFQYINFDDQEIEFRYNVSFSNSWEKQFTGTHYLGGSYIGDWLSGTEHTNNVTGVTLDDYEEDTLNALYDLAEYSGPCRVRTIEGANYSANVTVSDSSKYNTPGHSHNISLSITKIDNVTEDGVTKKDWEAE